MSGILSNFFFFFFSDYNRLSPKIIDLFVERTIQMKLCFSIIIGLIIFQSLTFEVSFGCIVSLRGKDYDGCGATPEQACATLQGCLEQTSNLYGIVNLTSNEQYEGSGFCGITNGVGSSLSNTTNLLLIGNSATIICRDSFFLRWFLSTPTFLLDISDLTLGLCSSDQDGGCISVDYLPGTTLFPTLQVKIDGLTVVNSTSKGNGGALALMNRFNMYQILNSTFSNCQSGSHGGAIYATHGPLTFSNNSLRSNSAQGHGGAAYFEQMEGGSFKDNLFVSNSANLDGGALWLGNYLQSASGFFVGNYFLQNKATYGGAVATPGAYPNASDNIQFESCSFSSNQATAAGGALYSANTCTQWNGDNFLVTDCKFSENRAGTDGGAMAASCGIIVALSSTFVGNIASGNGGAIFSPGLQVSDSEFNGNQAQGYGGGVALINASSIVAFTSVNISQNKANLGGGVAVILISDAPPYSKDFYLSFKLTTFLNNLANIHGGGMYLQGYLTDSSLFAESTFAGNSAQQNGGAMAFDQLTATSLEFQVPVMTNNTAGGSGGGFFINSSTGPLSLLGTIQSNLPDQIGCGSGSNYCQDSKTISQCFFCSTLCAINPQTTICYGTN